MNSFVINTGPVNNTITNITSTPTSKTTTSTDDV